MNIKIPTGKMTLNDELNKKINNLQEDINDFNLSYLDISKELNENLNKILDKKISVFFNSISREDFLSLQKNNIKLNNELFNETMQYKLIDNFEQFEDNYLYQIIKNKNYKLPDFNYYHFVNSKEYLKNILNMNSLKYTNTELLQLLNEKTVTVNVDPKYTNNFKIKNTYFKVEFIESIKDIIDNYEKYCNNPRMGKDKINKIFNNLVNEEISRIENKRVLILKNNELTLQIN